MNELKNWIPLQKFSLTRSYFVYLDMENEDGGYCGDIYLHQHNCHARFMKSEFRKEGSDYVFCICGVPRRRVRNFIRAMEDLDRGLTLMRGLQYTTLRDNFFQAALAMEPTSEIE